MVLNVFDVNVNPMDIPMTRIPFWVQVHGLPYTFRTEKVARSLAGDFAGFLDWDRRRSGESLRIRVWVSLEQPLKKGKLVATTGREPYKAVFKYEKLYNFCFKCGRLDHMEGDCKEVVVGRADQKRFGDWMRAMEFEEEEGPNQRNLGGRVV